MVLINRKRECSICCKAGVPLKQIKLPIPPFNIFYCKECWEGYFNKLTGKAKQAKAQGKGIFETHKALMEEEKA
jgi:hypothetical protein